MNFKTWVDQIDEDTRKMVEIGFGEMTESLSIKDEDGDFHSMLFTINSRGLTIKIGNSEWPIKRIRPMFAKNKERFVTLGETVHERVATYYKAAFTLLAEYTAELIPEAVMSRMKGDRSDTSPAELARLMAYNRVLKMFEPLNECRSREIESMSINLPDPTMGTVTITFSGDRYMITIGHGETIDSANIRMVTDYWTVEFCLQFLAKAPRIEKVIAKAINVFQTAVSAVGGSNATS